MTSSFVTNQMHCSNTALVSTSSALNNYLAVDGDTIRLTTERTPASAVATGLKGDICWDADYVYVCVATNTWKRSAIATWP